MVFYCLMFSRYLSIYKGIDWLMLLPSLFLSGLGLVEIYSISLSRSGGDLSIFKKQLFFTLIGLVAMAILIRLDYYIFYSYSNWFYLAGFVALVLVLIFGSEINGTKGWFDIFGFGVQPVELIKFILIIYLGRYLSGESTVQRPVRNLIITGLGVFVLMLLVLLQPDLGSSVLLGFIWVYLLFVSGLPKRYLAYMGVALVVVFVISWNFFLLDYQKNRITSLVNPGAVLTADYNVNQAIIAVPCTLR